MIHAYESIHGTSLHHDSDYMSEVLKKRTLIGRQHRVCAGYIVGKGSYECETRLLPKGTFTKWEVNAKQNILTAQTM